jgi:peptidyl-prolyl cis-trans isomerase A (cyclophilin A)
VIAASKRAVRLGLSALALSLALGAANTAWAQRVRLATSVGDIVLELDRDKAPKTVDNFVQYVRAGHYDGTVFHRVIDNFMIQGGGMKADLTHPCTDRARKPQRTEQRSRHGVDGPHHGA